jgi:hypothetical protein
MTKSGGSYSSKYEMVVPAVAGFKAFSDGALSLAGLLQASTTIAFHARLASATNYAIDSAYNQYRTVAMTETLDTVGCFSSGQFVAPVAGIYLFSFNAAIIAAGYTYFTPMTGGPTTHQIYFNVIKNPDGYGLGTILGSVVPSFTFDGGTPYNLVYESGIGFSCVAQLAAGDVVVPAIYRGYSSSGQVRLRSSYSNFSGVKIA